MTFEQSWQNISQLLSLVRPVDGLYLSFEFSAHNAFKILIKEIEIPDYVKSVIRYQTAKGLPFAEMFYDENGEDILSYDDVNGHWVINMTTHRINQFSSYESLSLEKAQKQFQELARMTKKS